MGQGPECSVETLGQLNYHETAADRVTQPSNKAESM